jgi:type I restriction enzyme R subunit
MSKAGPSLPPGAFVGELLVMEQLTIAGFLDPRRLYEDPFDGIAPQGPDAIFSDAQVTDLIAHIRRIDESADPSAGQATA